MINRIKRAMKSTRQTAPQHGLIIKFLLLLFEQVGQQELQTLIYSDGLAQAAAESTDTLSNSGERQLSSRSDLMRSRAEAKVPPTITPRTQVRNNLSLASWWICSEILGPFSDQIVCKTSQAGNLEPEVTGLK